MEKYKPTIKDFLIQSYLDIKTNYRFCIKKTKYGNFKVPEHFDKIFEENFNEYNSNWVAHPMEFLKEKWDTNIYWPDPFHPENLNQWVDEDTIKFGSDGIKLNAIGKPKYFESISKIIPNAVSYLRSKEAWQYGIFTFSVKLPKGTYLWPALWLSGEKSWPPEIDLLEGYTKNNINKIKLQTNLYFHEKSNILSIRGRSHKLPIEVANEFVEYSIWWEKEFISFYYNGYLVRKITNPKILKTFNEKQKIILNAGTQKGFFENNQTPFTIKEVRVYQ